MTSTLAQEACTPVDEGTQPLKGEELLTLAEALGGNWEIAGDHQLEKEYPFKDFMQALAFVNKLAEVAEEQGHHPDITLSWGRVKLQIWTHSIDGLSRSDFILAAKCDQLY